MSISCLFIEDNKAQLQKTKRIVEKHFPEISTMYEAASLEIASDKLHNKKYDLLLADIHLEDGLIFDLLKELPGFNTKIIFLTSHSEHALKAFQFSALNYLLKPFSEDELIIEIKKIIQLIEKENYHMQLETFFHNLNPTSSKRIVLKNHDLIHVVEIDSILYAQADNNYTRFFCEDRKILVSKSLKTYEDELAHHNFFRCHHSYLLNLNKIKALHKAGDAVILSDGSSVPVASSKKKLLYQLIG